MFSLRPAPLGLLLAVLAASSAAANTFTRVTWTTGGSTISNTRTRLVVEASGSARLERDHGPGALELGSPQPVLTGQLRPAELQALESAFGGAGWDSLPRQLPKLRSNPLELRLERPGRPTLLAEGAEDAYDSYQSLLEPVQQVMDAVRQRLQASSTELTLEIERMPLPQTLLADEDLELVVSGSGRPGVEFTSLRAVLSGRSLEVEALGRQVSLAPAQPWSQRLRVERPGRVGVGYLHVDSSRNTYGSAQVLIVQSETASSGRFTGQVVKKKGKVGLEVQVARGEKRFRPLNPAAAERLERFDGEYVQFEGRADSAGRLEIQRLIRPERRTVEGLMYGYGAIRAEGVGRVVTFGPVAKVLETIGRETPVEVEGWFFSEGGWTPPRRWYDTGGRRLYRGPRLYAERVRAKVAQRVKLKRGWRTRATLAPGREVWIRGRRFFGWSAEVETADGAEAGRARLKKRFDYARPTKLATEGGGVGISGALSGAGSP